MTAALFVVFKKSEIAYCTLSATDHRHQLSTGYQPNIADSQRTMLAEDHNENHNMRSNSAMTPDFERRNAAPDAGYAKTRRALPRPSRFLTACSTSSESLKSNTIGKFPLTHPVEML